MIRELSYRQMQGAIPAMNCLQEPDGAFAHLDDVAQFRIARMAQEISAQLRKFEAMVGPRRLEYALRAQPVNGQARGELIHPVDAEGKPLMMQMIIDPERLIDFELAMQKLLDETEKIDVREICASQLRRDGRIPAGYWTEQGPDGVERIRKLAPSAILAGLEPLIVMDLDES